MALPRIWSQWFAGAAWLDFEHNGYLYWLSLTYQKWLSWFSKGARNGADELSEIDGRHSKLSQAAAVECWEIFRRVSRVCRKVSEKVRKK
jgi:hypothetical protein|tara:strand:- start:152 stop:421 length:270 start_codon:yes stop_codon:yes gene_type:complete